MTSQLYDSRARAAFRSVQPFVNLEEAHKLGVALDETFEEEFRWSELYRLDTLWNIDKHRRLALFAWWPSLIYWGSNGPSNRRVCRVMARLPTAPSCCTLRDPTKVRAMS